MNEDNGTNRMNGAHETKSFRRGIAMGVAMVLVLQFVGSSFINAYRRHHNIGIDPGRKINQIVYLLENYYVGEVDRAVLIDSMFSGLVFGIGDVYTTYLSPETLRRFDERTEGRYAGIGVSVVVNRESNRIEIISAFEGAPGDRAGIRPGDKIMRVNGIDIHGDIYEEAVGMIKGPPGTSVTITLHRPSTGDTFDVDIVRDNIYVPTVAHRMVTEDIGYLRISGFERTTSEQFMLAYENLQAKGMKALIIDVRNNPGGLLQSVVEITDTLVDGDYIVFTENRQGQRQFIYADERRIEIPLAVLVNGNSASASEVLAGAVKDTNIGVLVGTRTFGKGVVQDLFRLADGSGVKITVSKYFTPSGICIDGEGIVPDYVVEMDEELTANIPRLTFEEDIQLQKAVELMELRIG